MTLPAIQDVRPDYDELITLPCFDGIETITPIAFGYSRACVSVTSQGKVYFVKKFVASNASLKQTARNERIFAVAAAKAGFSPAVVYQNPSWLVCEFIQALPLSSNILTLEEKTKMALDLMSQCHQLDVNLPRLDIAAVVAELTLALSTILSKQQLTIIDKLVTQILDSLNNERDGKSNVGPLVLVACHGDINFSNILFAEKPWLIDFECSCLAEKEFDLAMLIAVNELSTTQLHKVLNKQGRAEYLTAEHYNKKVCCYLAFCYLINGLWYLVYQQEKENKHFLDLATRLFTALDALSLIDDSFCELFAENEISC